jgi:hypothetical protein
VIRLLESGRAVKSGRAKSVAARLGAALLAVAGFVVPAAAQPTPFDGTWSVTLTCSPHTGQDDDAKGYTHRFDGTVSEGRLEATHGQKDQPGWHLLHGRILPDGSATLRLDGVVNNADYAINDAQRGMGYTYRVKARFGPDAGSGQRLTGRACEFRFAKRPG